MVQLRGLFGPLLVVAALVAGGCARAARPDAPAGREGSALLGQGLASFYGPGLHGNLTASGERFDKEGLTAAHRTLRFDTCLVVENQANGKRVRVRVNDRGPFIAGRVLDVSEGAARRLEMLQKGVARVRFWRCP